MIISLAERIHVSQPKSSQVALFWLGQAGFVIKSPDGTVLYIDAYLSNSVERKFGPQWKRIMPPAMPPNAIPLSNVPSLTAAAGTAFPPAPDNTAATVRIAGVAVAQLGGTDMLPTRPA